MEMRERKLSVKKKIFFSWTSAGKITVNALNLGRT
jgi:hypothetical protein